MFKSFLKRSTVAPASTAPLKPDQPAGDLAVEIKERRRIPRPLPIPEVHEGNGSDTEWDLWLELTQEQSKK